MFLSALEGVRHTGFKQCIHWSDVRAASCTQTPTFPHGGKVLIETVYKNPVRTGDSCAELLSAGATEKSHLAVKKLLIAYTVSVACQLLLPACSSLSKSQSSK